MIVMKFGGTSVESAEAIRRVAEIVRLRRKQDPVVVVSAMAKVTDQLVLMGQKAAHGAAHEALAMLPALRVRHQEAASELVGARAFPNVSARLDSTFQQLEEFLRGVGAVRELSPRSSDYLLSFGELLSSQFIAPALTEMGLDATWVDSRECVITDSAYTRAVPQSAETRERSHAVIRPILANGRVPVMGGFIASSRDGVPTTLGRGGSDYSAAIIGAALDAECIEIWTDVEGMMTTDPRLCAEARTIRHISFNEAAELAYFGAKVLHPATLLPAIEKNIPVYVLNSRNIKSTGTLISAQAPTGEEIFRAITAKKGISLVNVVASRGLMVHNFLRSVFEVLDQNGASVDLVAISEVSLSLTIDSKHMPAKLLAQLEAIADVTCEEEQAIVCLVGEDIHGKPGIAARVFGTVADAGVNVRMISQGASEINISFVIKESDVPRAVQHLHAEFFGHRENNSNGNHSEPASHASRNGAGEIDSNGSGTGKRRKERSAEFAGRK